MTHFNEQNRGKKLDYYDRLREMTNDFTMPYVILIGDGGERYVRRFCTKCNTIMAPCTLNITNDNWKHDCKVATKNLKNKKISVEMLTDGSKLTKKERNILQQRIYSRKKNDSNENKKFRIGYKRPMPGVEHGFEPFLDIYNKDGRKAKYKKMAQTKMKKKMDAMGIDKNAKPLDRLKKVVGEKPKSYDTRRKVYRRELRNKDKDPAELKTPRVAVAKPEKLPKAPAPKELKAEKAEKLSAVKEWNKPVDLRIPKRVKTPLEELKKHTGRGVLGVVPKDEERTPFASMFDPAIRYLYDSKDVREGAKMIKFGISTIVYKPLLLESYVQACCNSIPSSHVGITSKTEVPVHSKYNFVKKLSPRVWVYAPNIKDYYYAILIEYKEVMYPFVVFYRDLCGKRVEDLSITDITPLYGIISDYLTGKMRAPTRNFGTAEAEAGDTDESSD